MFLLEESDGDWEVACAEDFDSSIAKYEDINDIKATYFVEKYDENHPVLKTKSLVYGICDKDWFAVGRYKVKAIYLP